MEQDELLNRYQSLTRRLSSLPKKIVSLHSQDSKNISEFLLHDLCQQDCFNLNKAAFLIDNPDFDCVQGVAGFSKSESYNDIDKAWQEPEKFTSFMQGAPFNQKVRSFCNCSIKRNGKSYTPHIDKIAETLELEKPAFYVWDMKHDNHGVLVYERDELDNDLLNEHLLNSLYLFSFCPVH